ncbi:MAG: photosynthetic reaction center cytochrome c subunit [Gammaproteobacteria bacterium]|jgi:photosynthetic reaction center cytochrome c subunit|nr:photosynthetic reaction center cytochrome c subunit [Gammaproteobacteria bacterium]
MKILAWFIGFIFLILTGFMLLTAGWEAPPMDSEQSGFRGTGMVQVSNPRVDPARLQAQLEMVPEISPLPEDGGGPRAGDIYQNVQVLGDLSVARFTRIMQQMTEWVTPEEGCAGCHVLNNLADDSVYRKDVSRHMIRMTQAINSGWENHVQATGVTCYTCHRGQNVPEYTWFNADPAAESGRGLVGWRAGQNRAAEQVGLTSLPEDPFGDYLEGTDEIRIAGRTALPEADKPGTSIQHTEETYALMMHMSTSLDVNCTYCHNSRDFGSWEQSNPARVSAYHGIRMAQTLNLEHVAPVSDLLPPDRLGPTGEGRKVNCTTCHQGVNKPLGGLQMAENFPSLYGESVSSQASAEREEQSGELVSAIPGSGNPVGTAPDSPAGPR